mmetsp:Transcript_39476/g.100069  ORF Transcript_39476/g.100069 Transcript_39476/m.100069 type:complete len:237 (+) Transcript_39476:427-1137(+)
MSGKSRPLEATSVATSTSFFPPCLIGRHIVSAWHEHLRRHYRAACISGGEGWHLECIDGLKALLLSFVAMDGNGLHTLAKEVLVDDVDIHLVFREDQHRRGGLLQAFQQVDDLRLLFHVLYFLDDIQVGGAGAADVDGDGLDKRTLCKCPDLHGHGRAEHQRLPLAAKVTQDLSDILLKAKVHHSVSLIQAKIPAAVQRHALLVQQVLQAPGSGHDDVAPAAQDVCLRADVDAADG